MTTGKKGKTRKKESTQTKPTEPPDLASFEGMLPEMFEDFDEEETPSRKAQELIYDAWDIPDRKRRIPRCIAPGTDRKQFCMRKKV
jgi:hypothetical protein